MPGCMNPPGQGGPPMLLFRKVELHGLPGFLTPGKARYPQIGRFARAAVQHRSGVGAGDCEHQGSNFRSRCRIAEKRGSVQLIPETAERFQRAQCLAPPRTSKGGLAYLRWLLAYFPGVTLPSWRPTNAGEGAVDHIVVCHRIP